MLKELFTSTPEDKAKFFRIMFECLSRTDSSFEGLYLAIFVRKTFTSSEIEEGMGLLRKMLEVKESEEKGKHKGKRRRDLKEFLRHISSGSEERPIEIECAEFLLSELRL